MFNLTKFPPHLTAKTRSECANQRIEHLACLGSQKVLELCVGPSLKVLEEAGIKHQIEVYGNDIDPTWKAYYPKGNWLLGDALKISWEGFDTVVFAPPLSRGCSGARADALTISQVFPSYDAFLSRSIQDKPKIGVLTLPARCLATSRDRNDFYHLLYKVKKIWDRVEYHPLKADGIRKYVDLYCTV